MKSKQFFTQSLKMNTANEETVRSINLFTKNVTLKEENL